MGFSIGALIISIGFGCAGYIIVIIRVLVTISASMLCKRSVQGCKGGTSDWRIRILVDLESRS